MRGSFDETSDIITDQDAKISRLERLLRRSLVTFNDLTLHNPSDAILRAEVTGSIESELDR